MGSGEAAGHLHKENEDHRGGEEEVNVDEGSSGPVVQCLVRSPF